MSESVTAVLLLVGAGQFTSFEDAGAPAEYFARFLRVGSDRKVEEEPFDLPLSEQQLESLLDFAMPGKRAAGQAPSSAPVPVPSPIYPKAEEEEPDEDDQELRLAPLLFAGSDGGDVPSIDEEPGL